MPKSVPARPLTLKTKSPWVKWLPIGLSIALVAVLAPVYYTTLAPGLTWHNNGADGGDLATAAWGLGVAHPTGYPTYLLLAHLFQLLPIGALGLRTNVFSAVCALIAAALTISIVRLSYAGPRRFAWAGGLVAGLGFGLSPLLWSQAVITEVYALHTLFIAALTLLALLAVFGAVERRTWYVGAGGVLFGLALGNHLTTILLLPVWLLLIGWQNNRLQWRTVLVFGICFVVGLCVYFYIPYRANLHPFINWGGANTWSGFIWLVTGQGYSKLAFGLPSDLIISRISAWAGLTLAQFSWPGFLLALYGLIFGRFKTYIPQALTVWLFVAYSVFAMGYATSDSSAYLLPAFLALAVWFGVGFASAMEVLTGQWQALHAVGMALVMLALFTNAVRQLPALDASHDLAAEIYAASVVTVAPQDAIIVTSGDRDTFALWFYQYNLRLRPDILLIDEPLWQFPWYRANLAYTYPEQTLPTGDNPSLPQFLTDSGRYICKPDLQAVAPDPPLICNDISN